MNIVVLCENDVAEIHADPKYDPLFLGRLPIALGHPTLHRDRTGDGLDHTRELDQKAVAGRFDDAAFVVSDLGVYELAAMGSEAGESVVFVQAHETTVSGYIGGENSREPSFDPLSAQCVLPGGRSVASSRPEIL